MRLVHEHIPVLLVESDFFSFFAKRFSLRATMMALTWSTYRMATRRSKESLIEPRSLAVRSSSSLYRTTYTRQTDSLCAKNCSTTSTRFRKWVWICQGPNFASLMTTLTTMLSTSIKGSMKCLSNLCTEMTCSNCLCEQACSFQTEEPWLYHQPLIIKKH